MVPEITNAIKIFYQGFLNQIYSNILCIRNSIKNNLYLKILLILTFSGLILRLYHLDDVSIWLDEGLTLAYSSHSIYDIWVISTTTSPNPPLFYWLEHFMFILGHNEVILRLISVIIGTFTIPFFYYAGKQFYNEDIGIISAALLTFSSFHIFYSQEARAYVLLLFFLTIAFIWYLKALETNNLKIWLFFGVFSALAFWTHFFAIIPVGTLFLYAFIRCLIKSRYKISKIKPILLSGIFFLILSSPLFLIILHAIKAKAGSIENWGIQGFNLNLVTFIDILGPWRIQALLLGTFLIIGVISLFSINREKFLFLVFLILVPLSVLYYISFRMTIVSRYAIFLVLFIILGISFFFYLFHSRVKKPLFPVIIIIIIALICLPSLDAYYLLDSKNGEDWRGAAMNIRNMAGQGDSILIVPGFYSVPFNYYYNNTSEKTYELTVKNQSELNTVLSANKEKTVFLIVTNLDLFNSSSWLSMSWIKEHFTLKFKKDSISIYSTR